VQWWAITSAACGCRTPGWPVGSVSPRKSAFSAPPTRRTPGPGSPADHRQGGGTVVFRHQPALERTWHGPDVNQGVASLRVPRSVTTSTASSVRSRVVCRLRRHRQHRAHPHATTAAVRRHRLNVSPLWEINIGVGVGARQPRPSDLQSHTRPSIDWGRHSPWTRSRFPRTARSLPREPRPASPSKLPCSAIFELRS